MDDASKPTKLRWGLLPWAALEVVVEVLEHGARKYSPNGWLTVPDGVNVYREALLRHAAELAKGAWLDPDSGRPHAAHVCCDALILMALKAAEVKP